MSGDDAKWDMGRAEVLRHALAIAEDYDGNLTLRQLYYRFVATGLAPSSQAVYKKIGQIVGDARMEGDFPLEWLIDRTRESQAGHFSGNSVNTTRAATGAQEEFARLPESWIWRSRWFGQPNHVSVWVEKEALAGVFEGPCTDLGVSSMPIRLRHTLKGGRNVARACRGLAV